MLCIQAKQLSLFFNLAQLPKVFLVQWAGLCTGASAGRCHSGKRMAGRLSKVEHWSAGPENHALTLLYCLLGWLYKLLSKRITITIMV